MSQEVGARPGIDDIGARVRAWHGDGRRAVWARVVGLQGFSTWSGDELVVLDDTGRLSGDILGRYGAGLVSEAGADVLAGPGTLFRLVIEVHGPRIVEAGLSCGGQADLLLQPTGTVPDQLWAALEQRSPVALVTRIDGPAAGPMSVAVHPDGSWEGSLGPRAAATPASGGAPPPPFPPRSSAPATAMPVAALVEVATELLGTGHSGSRQISDAGGTILVEAWVPAPRLVVVGSGELVGAISAQGGLLGWESRHGESLDDLDGLLGWAGGSAAMVVLSHDPQVDVDALARGLAAGIGYVGAMGSRRTQSRRVERLAESGVHRQDVARIHRPVGLDLGGRSAAEVAMSICAEILAVRRGRDGGPLSERSGPINTRPGSS